MIEVTEELEASAVTLSFIEAQLKYFSRYIGAPHDQDTVIRARRYYERLLKIKQKQLSEMTYD